MDRKYSTGGSELVCMFMNKAIPGFMKNDRTYQTNLDHIWTTEDYLHFFENSKMICDFAENFRMKFEIDFLGFS